MQFILYLLPLTLVRASGYNPAEVPGDDDLPINPVQAFQLEEAQPNPSYYFYTESWQEYLEDCLLSLLEYKRIIPFLLVTFLLGGYQYCDFSNLSHDIVDSVFYLLGADDRNGVFQRYILPLLLDDNVDKFFLVITPILYAIMWRMYF